MLARAASEGFDTVLWHGEPHRASARRRASWACCVDRPAVDRAEAEAPAGLFTTLPRPTLDPRHGPAIDTQSIAVVTGPESATALARFWGERITALRDEGFAGVRLLGLSSLPGPLLPGFLAELRLACLDADAVRLDAGPRLGRAEGDTGRDARHGRLVPALVGWKRRVAVARARTAARAGAVVADAGENAPAARRTLSALMADGWMTHQPDAGG